jgi:SAM-dependent methyltransferase
MLTRAILRIEPTLIHYYRRLTEPPPPNCRGDRDIEYSWIVANMPEGPGEALEFGCGNSWLSLVAARRGFHTLAIDLTPVAWPYVHPLARFVQTDVLELNVPPASLDLVINCSAIEHVGLQRYGDGGNADGDLAAMQRMRGFLKPGGVMLLTIPVGQDATIAPLHRIYGTERLPLLLNKFRVETREYWMKDNQNRWVAVVEGKALNQELRPNIYALGCFVLTVGANAQGNG